MKCSDMDELISAYANDELSPAQRESVEEHLSHCPHCRETLAACEKVKQSLVSLRDFSAPANLAETTMTKIKSSTAKNHFQNWLRPVMTAGAAVIILAILLVSQPWGIKSPEALAASIVRNSPEVQAALNGEEIEEVEVTTKVVDDEGNVLMVLVKTERRAVATRVNLDTKQVTEIVRVHVPEFEEGDEQKALDIAKADPRVQELLAQGGVVKEVHLGHSIDIAQVTGPDGVTRKEGTAKPTAFVSIDLKGKAWSVAVDLDEERVMGIGKPSAATLVASMSHLIFSIITPFVAAIGVLIILGLALRNRLAGKIASVASMVLGIIGLYGGLYAFPVGRGDQFLALGIPVLGLVMGIAGIKSRANRHWAAITGVVLCSLALVLDTISIIAYPDRHTWVIITTSLVLIGIVAYAFYDKIKKVSQKWLRPALGVTAAMIFLAILLITQPWALSPQSVMAKAYAATSNLQSYRMFSSIKSTLEGKTLEATFETEFVAPDRHRGKATTNGDWVEFIIIGDKQYIRDSDPSRTTSVGVSSSSILSKEDTLKIIDSLTDLEKLPDEKIDGVDCIHYRGMVDVDRVIEEQKAKLDPRQPHYEEMLKGLEDMRNMKTEVELWIGKEDYLIRQMKHDMQVPSEDTGKLDTSSSLVKYYDFNEPIVIEPPESASGELLPGWRLVENFPLNKQTFSSDVTVSIGGEDLTHQQISFRISITNVSAEAASNIRVSLATMATNEDKWIWNSPGPVTLEPGESETYYITWEYDASDTSKEELARLVNLTTVLAKYTTPKGEEAVQLLFPDAPYPTRIPPANPPGR